MMSVRSRGFQGGFASSTSISSTSSGGSFGGPGHVAVCALLLTHSGTALKSTHCGADLFLTASRKPLTRGTSTVFLLRLRHRPEQISCPSPPLEFHANAQGTTSLLASSPFCASVSTVVHPVLLLLSLSRQNPTLAYRSLARLNMFMKLEYICPYIKDLFSTQLHIPPLLKHTLHHLDQVKNSLTRPLCHCLA